MNKWKYLLLSLSFLHLLLPLSAFADAVNFISLGYSAFDFSDPSITSSGNGIRVVYGQTYRNGTLGYELHHSQGTLIKPAGINSAKVDLASGIYFRAGKPLGIANPFLLVGYGFGIVTYDPPNTSLYYGSLSYGVGIELRLSRHLHLRSTLIQVVPGDKNTQWNLRSLAVALQYVF